MPIKISLAIGLIGRLASLPYFPSQQPEAVDELVKALANEADSFTQAEAAIAALLGDTCRAENPDTNRSPSPGELRAWVQAEKEADIRFDDPSPEPRFCGRLVPGWTYLGFDPATPSQDARKVLMPSKCERGWIHRTVWLPAKPARVDENGNDILQPYDYSGRCRCQPGGTL